MSNVKEFDVTDGFINLGEEVTECQDRESFEKCSTRNYLHQAREECACTPFSLSHLNDTVNHSRRIFKIMRRIMCRRIFVLLLDLIASDRFNPLTGAFLLAEDCTLMSMWTKIFLLLRVIQSFSLLMRAISNGKEEISNRL